ncbi:MAG TPA: RHS repeat-associated core domain-containing protein [Thiobacillaceae bacterium]|nr:RHS repeat-associated core domain-containing protein [Thiobacillaceae bacterium]
MPGVNTIQKTQDGVCSLRTLPGGTSQQDPLDPDCTEELSCPAISVPKTLGTPLAESCTGNPVHIGTGNKVQQETDYGRAGAVALTVSRTYNSQSGLSGEFGVGWSAFARLTVTDASHVTAARPDGKRFNYVQNAGTWTTDADVTANLVFAEGSYRLTTASGGRETYGAGGKLLSVSEPNGQTQTLTYDGTGLLQSITDAYGRQLTFTHDGLGRIATMTVPTGVVYRYAYDASGNLASVAYPDATPGDDTDNPRRIYHYEDTRFPNALTGITDENGQRFATYAYDATGRAVLSEHATSAGRVDLAYNPDGTTTVTDALGANRTYGFTTILGVVKATGQDQPAGAGCGPASSNITYDGNGNVTSRTDFNGHATTYAYDLARNLETGRTEAVGTPEQRIVETDWHPRLRLPVEVREKDASGTLVRTTRLTYDGDNQAVSPKGDLTRREIIDNLRGTSRGWTWTYSYSATVPGALLQKVEDGPRTDVADLTTYDYYPPDTTCEGAADGPGRDKGCRGQLMRITNARGYVIRLTRYNAHGQPETILDLNGKTLSLEYGPRGWLKSRSLAGEITQYDYDNVGQLIRITRPDGSYVRYQYDAAHHLTDIIDPEGNRIHYTLDGMGNRIGEEILNATGTVLYTRTRHFDALSRLWQDIGALNQTLAYGYDANGNLKTRDGPRNDVNDLTGLDYDAHDRLIRVTHPDGGVEAYGYDALGRLSGVQDPKLLDTAYTVDALGNLLRTDSPDTGVTTRTYDAAGNLKTETDARNVTVSYTYDALNRLTSKSSSHPNTPTYTYTYDVGLNGVGHLYRVSRNGSAHLLFRYTSQGRLRYKQQTIGSAFTDMGYLFDPYGRLSQINYPTGRGVIYGYDAQGRVSQISTQAADGSGLTVLASDFVYDYPFAGPQGYRYGNGRQMSMNRDLDYRPDHLIDGPREVQTAHDEAGNIVAQTHPSGPVQNYTYDANDRLIAMTDSAPGGFGSLEWDYDPNGNRTGETRNGATLNYLYSPSDSNWLAQAGGETRTRTPGGNTAFGTSIGTLSYDGYGRLAQSGNTRYEYNALGERVKKLRADGSYTLFHYGSDGELLFERDSSGASRVYVWLDGRPLARIDNDTALYYYHTDHLGTPQAMTDAAGQVVWQADYEPFGKAVVKVNSVQNNLRLPGQYFDAESGLHYNFFRDYDPGLGRYIQADPIGLAGGLNLYAYVGGNPVSKIDPLGLTGATGTWDTGASSSWNGNVTPGYKEQDWVCSSPAGILNGFACTKQCCIEHDECYEKHKCNATSWGSPFSSECQQCNMAAVKCVVTGNPKMECGQGCNSTFNGAP